MKTFIVSKRWSLLLAIALPFVALGVQFLMWPYVQPFVWIFFYPAVFFSAWIGGLRSAVISTILSALLVVYFFLPPKFSFITENPYSFFSIGVFFLMGLLFGIAQERLKNAYNYIASNLGSEIAAKEILEIRSRENNSRLEATEKAFEQSEGKFKSIIENSPDAIFLIDNEGKYIYSNRSVTGLLGFTDSELRAKTIIEVAPEGRSEEFLRLFKSLLSEGKLSTELGLLRKDGKTVQVDLNAVLMPDGVVCASCRDINDRIKAEDEIRTLNERISVANSAAKVGIWDWDIQRNILVWDDRMYELYGLENSMFSGAYEAWLNGLHPDDREACDKESKKALEGEKDYDTEFRVIWPDGSIHFLRASGTVFRDKSGTPVRMVGANFDITDQKESLYKIALSYDNFSKVFEFNPVPLVITSVKNGICVIANNSFTLFSGYSIDEITGKKANELNLYADLQERMTLLSEIKEKNRVRGFEIQIRTKSGDVRIGEMSIERIIYNNEECILSAITDITERKRVQNSLSLSNQNFLKTFELNANALAITVLQDGRILTINKAFTDLFGFSPDEAVGKSTIVLKIFLHPSERETLIAKLKKDSKIRNHEMQICNKSNEAKVIEVSMDMLIYNGEECVLSSFQDITERNMIEKELSEYRSDLERQVEKRTREVKKYLEEVTDLYENAPCGYHSIGIDGKLERINNTELKWLGYERNELINKPISKILTPSSELRFREIFAHFIQNGIVDNIEMEFLRKDNTILFVSLNATAIYDDQQNFLYSRSTIFDISDRIHNEKELQKAKLAAENANKAKSEFLANMSHEIRTPMNAVLGYTELLGSTLINSTQKSYIESIRSSGKSLLTLINDILDLSKVEAGKLQLEYDYISTYSFFYEFESIFRLKVKEKKLSFLLDIDKNLPEGLYADEARLRQVIFNLLGNAIKFTSEGFVSLKVGGEELNKDDSSDEKESNLIDLIIEVQDTGIGISLENQRSIFEPFVQEREFRTYGGTGLGLSISKRLVELMNGSLVLTSIPGKGCTFTINIPRIPFIDKKLEKAGEFEIDPSKIIFRESVVLVVDDVKHNRDLIQDSLAKTSLKVIEADDGDNGYKMACDCKPDIIITDIRMPVMNGFELLDKIKSNENLKDVPVVAYSAEVLKEQKERISRSKFSALLVKPVKVRDLYLELMNWIPYTTVSSADDINHNVVPEGLEEITDIIELIKILQTQLYVDWEKFAVRQPINEIKVFGKRIIETGVEFNSMLVKDYGNALLDSIENFDIDKLLVLIRKYPEILSEIKSRLPE